MKFIFFSIILHFSILAFGISIYPLKEQPILKLKLKNNFDTAKILFNSDSFQSKSQPIEDKIEKSVDNKTLEIADKLISQTNSKPKTLTEKKIAKKNNTKIVKEKKEQNQNLVNSDIIEISEGIFAARNQGIDGLKYSFISQPEPEYPLAAKRISFNNEVSIRVRFLVDFNGNIEEIKFYNTKDNLGFQNEVQKTLKNWKLTPVILNGKPIKLYFYKEFKFNQKQI
ncbi:MAG: energy transducer TonB [Cetobacterium sp.]